MKLSTPQKIGIGVGALAVGYFVLSSQTAQAAITDATDIVDSPGTPTPTPSTPAPASTAVSQYRSALTKAFPSAQSVLDYYKRALGGNFDSQINARVNDTKNNAALRASQPWRYAYDKSINHAGTVARHHAAVLGVHGTVGNLKNDILNAYPNARQVIEYYIRVLGGGGFAGGIHARVNDTKNNAALRTSQAWRYAFDASVNHNGALVLAIARIAGYQV